MITMDYDDLGFKCGIEIHQQLASDTKLFCNCTTELEDTEPVAKIQRQLRAVAGESGAVDEAAAFEAARSQTFTYNLYPDTTCLVEMDEEPPHPLNEQALSIGLQVAKLMNAHVPDEIHVMRKTVVDGSNTTGFQRTAIIGLDGELSTDEGTVAIEDIELEEESAGIHTRDEHSTVYDLNRLGIPLIELGTDASIQNPTHAREVAKKIGMLLRSTQQVKRGLGTIRQDVNVSIEEGARVEIKGFQDVDNMDKLVENEVKRQQSLVEIRERLQDRGIENIEPQIHDVTEIFETSENQIIERIIESDGGVYAMKVPLDGYLAEELCPGKTLGSELADYAKAQGIKGIMHTDEDLTRYGLTDEFNKLGQELDRSQNDLLIIAAGHQDRAPEALEAVADRIALLPAQIPEETRNAQDDFTTTYARPLPGAARMYPETDIPPFTVDETYLESIEVPETLEEKRERLTEAIGEQLTEQLLRSDRLESYEALADTLDLDKEMIANLFVNILPDVEARHDLDTSQIPEDRLATVLEKQHDGTISSDSLPELVKELATDPAQDIETIIEQQGLGTLDEDEIRTVVESVVEEKKDMIKEQGQHAQGALMGLVMQRVDGSPDGSTVSRILAETMEPYVD